LIKKRYLILIIIVCLFAISAVSAEKISDDAGMNVNDYDSSLITESVDENLLGDSYGSFDELQEEINAVEEGGTLNLTRNYKYVNGSTTGINITKSLTIYGNNYSIDGNNQSRIFNVKSSEISFNDIFFINANHYMKYNYMGGGAIYLDFEYCSINLTNCEFINNSATYGGAINSWYSGCFINLINCEFVNNFADYGGAIYISTRINMTDSKFINNFATDGGAIYFESIYNSAIAGCKFVNNSASKRGGAIYFGSSSGQTEINYCKFINNFATDGGAIYFNYDYYENDMANCDFINNSASNKGGAMYLTFSSVEDNIDYCKFVNNSAAYGGAIYFDYDYYNSNITNCDFINNSASKDGGAIFIGHIWRVILSNLNFINNSASNGGAIFSDSNAKSNSNYIIKNTNFINNSADYGSSIYFLERDQWGIEAEIIDSYFYTNENKELIYSMDSNGYLFLKNNTMISHKSYKIYTKSSSSIISSKKYLILENGTCYVYKPFALEFMDDNGNIIRSDKDIPITFVDLYNKYPSFQINATSDQDSEFYYIYCNQSGVYNLSVDTKFCKNFTIVPSILEVNSVKPDLSINTINRLYSENTTFFVNVTVGDYLVNAGNIDFYIDNKNIGSADVSNGLAIFNYTYLNTGTFNITAIYDENSDYLSSNITTLFTVNKMPTALSAESVIFDEKGNKIFTVELKDDNSNGVSGQNVKIEVIKYSGESRTFNGITDVDGIAEYNVKNLEGGMWFVTGTYDGNENYINSKFTDKFIVIRMDTTTNIEGIDEHPIVNHTYKLKANIHDENGKLVKEGIVQFYLDGVDIGFIDLSKNQGHQDALLGASNPVDYILGEDDSDLYIEYTPSKVGNYTLSAVYEGTTIYKSSNETTNLFVVNKISDYNITAENLTIYKGQSAEIVVNVPSDATGNILLRILSYEYILPIIDGTATVVVSDLSGYSMCGFFAFLVDDPKYEMKSVYGTITILPKVSDYNITAENLIIYGEQSAEIVVNVPSDATGNILLRILSYEYTLLVIDGTATVVVSDLSGYSMCGFFAFLVDDPKYEMKSVYGTITILPKVSNYTIYSPDVDVYCGETANITVYLPQDATGRLKVLYDDMDVGYVYINEGVATFKVTDQMSRVHTIDFYYEGDSKYNPKSTSVVLTVHKYSEYLFNTTDVYIDSDETANIIAYLPNDTTGTANIRIFNDKFEYESSTTVNNGQIIFNVDGLKKDAEFIIEYLGDYRYESKSVSGNIFVKNTIIIDAPDITKYYMGSEKFIVTLTDKNKPIDGADVEITIEGKNITKTTDSKGKVYVDLNQNKGTYIVTTAYEDLLNISKVIIMPAPTKTVLSGVKNINIGDSLTLTANVNASVGSVTFKVGSTTQKVDVVGGKASYTISDLSSGSYDVSVTYVDSNGNYLTSSDSKSFTVSKLTPALNVVADDIFKGRDAVFEITLSNDATGNVIVNINNKDYTAVLSGGKATINVPGLPVGNYSFTVSYSGDVKYNSKSTNGTLSVIDVNVNLIVYDFVKYYGAPYSMAVQLLDDSEKTLSGQKIIFNINGIDYTRTTNDWGIAAMNINLNSGNYTIGIRFDGNDEYDAINATASVEIKPTVSGNNITKIFRNATQYYAKFLDINGNILKNTPVEFNINGIFYTRTTNENGVAQLNINLNPGEYIITAKNPNSGEMYSNVVTVLPNIVENNDLIKYHRNASQYTVKIIGEDGKAVGAGVEVTFNINGVFYTRSTNASGIAKLNINLEPGKYIITATYAGCNVANKITVLPVLTASDLTKKYGTFDQFIATLVDGQGKPYAGQSIQFNINGVFYNRSTDSNGQARLNIFLQPGEYIITSSYNGSNIANKVTVVA